MGWLSACAKRWTAKNRFSAVRLLPSAVIAISCGLAASCSPTAKAPKNLGPVRDIPFRADDLCTCAGLYLQAKHYELGPVHSIDCKLTTTWRFSERHRKHRLHISIMANGTHSYLSLHRQEEVFNADQQQWQPLPEDRSITSALIDDFERLFLPKCLRSEGNP